MRLTYELWHKGSGQYDTDNTNDMPIKNIWKAINKLGKLEDIEEELGIDLVTLLKALILNNDICVFTRDGIKYVSNEISLNKDKIGFYLNLDDVGPLYIDDYGKKEIGGWALTKEELE